MVVLAKLNLNLIKIHLLTNKQLVSLLRCYHQYRWVIMQDSVKKLSLETLLKIFRWLPKLNSLSMQIFNLSYLSSKFWVVEQTKIKILDVCSRWQKAQPVLVLPIYKQNVAQSFKKMLNCITSAHSLHQCFQSLKQIKIKSFRFWKNLSWQKLLTLKIIRPLPMLCKCSILKKEKSLQDMVT